MLNIGFISLDIIILLIILIALLLVSYKTGKRVITALILSVYPSVIIFQHFPYVSFEPGKPEAISFLVIYIVTFIALNRHVSNKKLHTSLRKITDYSLLSLAYLVLMISISSNTITSLQNLYTFSGFIPNLVHQTNFGIILIIPLIILLLTNKSDKY